MQTCSNMFGRSSWFISRFNSRTITHIYSSEIITAQIAHSIHSTTMYFYYSFTLPLTGSIVEIAHSLNDSCNLQCGCSCKANAVGYLSCEEYMGNGSVVRYCNFVKVVSSFPLLACQVAEHL
jgi:hypothetical protein